jgi:hypothetical protein
MAKKQQFAKRPLKVKKSSAKAKAAPIPVSYARTTKMKVAQSKTRKNGDMVVTHSELVASVAGTTAYSTLLSRAVNPGLAEVFPWLFQIASRFEKYRFKKLSFRFVPSCPTSSPGALGLAFDFDVRDPIPGSAMAFAQNDPCVKGPPYRELVLSIPPDRMNLNGPRFTRTGVYDNTDPRLYDLGRVMISTESGVAAAAWGDLYVDYVIELLIPQFNNATPSVQVTQKLGSQSPSQSVNLPATTATKGNDALAGIVDAVANVNQTVQTVKGVYDLGQTLMTAVTSSQVVAQGTYDDLKGFSFPTDYHGSIMLTVSSRFRCGSTGANLWCFYEGFYPNLQPLVCMLHFVASPGITVLRQSYTEVCTNSSLENTLGSRAPSCQPAPPQSSHWYYSNGYYSAAELASTTSITFNTFVEGEDVWLNHVFECDVNAHAGSSFAFVLETTQRNAWEWDILGTDDTMFSLVPLYIGSAAMDTPTPTVEGMSLSKAAVSRRKLEKSCSELHTLNRVDPDYEPNRGEIPQCSVQCRPQGRGRTNP